MGFTMAFRNQLRERDTHFWRLTEFSDAVFAIAITLLVLDIKVPDVPTPFRETELITQLFHLWPQFEGFIISFLMIGTYWIVHHRVFHYIKRYNFRLVWINLPFLLLIVLTLFPASRC